MQQEGHAMVVVGSILSFSRSRLQSFPPVLVCSHISAASAHYNLLFWPQQCLRTLSLSQS
uniref:Uncharacterized protein n=1 Tax=Arundo donax TaxID=35708 RepID=A0A0A9BI39_ARUDO